MTEEEYEKHIPDIAFQFMVFQAYPQKDLLYIYLDGSESRKVLNRKHFLNLIQAKFPDLMKDAYEACLSTSFYLFSIPDRKIIHLFPDSHGEPYSDNLVQVLKDAKRGKQTKHMVTERKTLEEVISGYGFSQPTAESTKNLKVSLEKRPEGRDTLMGRFLSKFGR